MNGTKVLYDEGLVKQAEKFATFKHASIGQTRKYTGEPYINHPRSVVELVRSVPHTAAMLAAAWLHDTVEDTHTSLEEIHRYFGSEVATLVYSLTDVSKPEDGNREQRKSIDREHYRHASPDAQTIKLADMIDNSRTIVELDPGFAKTYMREKELLLPYLEKGNPNLFRQAQEIVCSYKRSRVLPDKERELAGNYPIVTDPNELDKFLQWLPELANFESYYACVFARKKYHPSAKNDKSNVKRFAATSKSWLKRKLKQLEIPIGCYTNKDGSIVDAKSLAVYMCINPRSLQRANVLTLKKLADCIADGNPAANPASIALTSIHAAKSYTFCVDVDFDGVEYDAESIHRYINPEAYARVQTRGGFHLLVRPDKVSKEFNGSWYKGLQNLEGWDGAGDSLTPVPGCTQGGFTPRFYLD